MNIKTWQEKYAYEREHEVTDSQTRCKWMQEEIDVLRAAIDAPEQEPVAWFEFNESLKAWFLSYGLNPKAKTRPLYAKPQPASERYQLPDSLYPSSKDWVQGDYAERVEWLHSMYENQREQTEMYVQASQPVSDLTDLEITQIFCSLPDDRTPIQRHYLFARAVLAAQKVKR